MDLSAPGVNPLVSAATPLLLLASRLRGSASQRDVPALRNRLVGELGRFEREASAAGVAPQTVRIAHYALCATIDDLVLNTPWGHQGDWSTQSLVRVFHNEVTGGDRFFEILTQLNRNASGQRDLLELMYLCLSLGFEGRLRVVARGSSEHTRTRDELFRQIREQRGAFERELSPHWRGVRAAHKPLTSKIPLWVLGLTSVALLLVVYFAFMMTLSSASAPVAYATLAKLPPAGPVVISGGTPPTFVTHVQRLREFLAPDIAAQTVTVGEDQRTITITIRGGGMFRPGSAEVQPVYVDLLGRIGAAIETEPGNVLVTGHTDSTPIHTIRFPSNFDLSLARAKSASAIIAAKMTRPDRITAEGKADSVPAGPNATPEQNRRIEVVLVKPIAS